jgi:PPP family 3-phenylpropionic acid transporter
MGAPPNVDGLRRDPRTRLALFYAAHFGHMGIVLPFLPLWLLSLGLDSVAIGLLVALSPLSKILTPWTWGRLADRTGLRRGLLVASSLAAAGALWAVAGLTTLGPLIVGVGLYAFCVAPALPFAEATALEQADARGFAYGRVRLWGSLSFVAVAAASGAVIGGIPGRALLYAASAMLALAALAASGFPAPAHVGRPPTGRGSAGVTRSLRDASLWRLLAACALMQAGHGPYYAFYSIRLERLGYGGAAIGLLWALAVICEVLLLTRVDVGVRRLGTAAILRLSLSAASVRWAIIAVADDPLLLAAAQTLHAMTYAAFHVAALREIHRRFPPEDRATGQALYSGLTYGLGIFCGTLGAGLLAERVGLSSLFGISAATSLVALLVLGRGRR